METEKIISHIVSDRNLPDSEEFQQWMESSEENRKEFVRYKNTWAMLQQRGLMPEQQIAEGYQKVSQRLGLAGEKGWIRVFLRYAAVALVAVVTGYLFHSLTLNPAVTMNEISVPHGNRSLIKLPDGSTVWLSNGSKLVYPDKFANDGRSLMLEGEAFFNVAHNEKEPFVVSVGEHRVKVLGTEFSLIAYPDDDILQVDLVSGRVEMNISGGNGKFKSFSIEPSQSLIFDKASGKITRAIIPDSFYSYWQNGIYSFKDESFASLATKIERIYGVEVIFEDEGVKERTFTGTFGIDDNIYTMVEVFKRASARPFEYRMEKKRIFIKSVK